MRNEDLMWRRRLITEVIAKTRDSVLLTQEQRTTNFGSGSRGSIVFMGATVRNRELERTLSHISNEMSTSTN